MEVQGFAHGRFGLVRECFAGILAAQPGTGAAFAAWCGGRLVVDLWGGYADSGRRRRWEQGSVVQPYSVSKPFAAVCALRLVQAGRLKLDAPVQRYWPGFRAPATVRQVLSHQAGVVMLDRQVPTEAFYDWDWLCALLAAQQPAGLPGPRTANRHCSTGTWPGNWSAGSTGAASAGSWPRRSAGRPGWTSPLG